jgi:hypothetical protein
MGNQRQQDHEAPASLVHALKRLQPKAVDLPDSVDDAVLGAARRRLASIRGKRDSGFSGWAGIRNWPAWIKIPALAAAGLLLALLARPYLQPETARFAREDVNRDGQVDILDAFALGRDLQSGTRPGPTLDLNGDGVVDLRDMETIAAEAVRLDKTDKKGGRS